MGVQRKALNTQRESVCVCVCVSSQGSDSELNEGDSRISFSKKQDIHAAKNLKSDALATALSTQHYGGQF